MISNGQTSIPIEELFIDSVHEQAKAQDEPAISIEQLRHLILLIDQSDVAELEVKQSDGKARLLLRKAIPGAGLPLQTATEPASYNEETAQAVEPIEQTVITSPLVGTFQSRLRSKDAPLVKVGDLIQVGQHVGAIKALNIPSEVESTVAGRVVEILVEDGQPVEYGQPLMVIGQ